MAAAAAMVGLAEALVVDVATGATGAAVADMAQMLAPMVAQMLA